MKRKKTNPNRIPISPKNYDLEKIREQELVKIRELTSVSLSLQRSSSVIHTEGDLTHFIRTITTIAVSAAFAIIAEPMIRKRILSSEELRIVLQRAAMNEEIADGEISVQDIQQILLNEYSLKLINVSGQCSLGEWKMQNRQCGIYKCI